MRRARRDIQNPNSSGQGYDPDHVKNPYHEILERFGYRYSHSTPVQGFYGGSRRIHHTYGRESHGVTVWYAVPYPYDMLSGWVWETSTPIGRRRNYRPKSSEHARFGLEKHLLSKSRRYKDLALRMPRARRVALELRREAKVLYDQTWTYRSDHHLPFTGAVPLSHAARLADIESATSDAFYVAADAFEEAGDEEQRVEMVRRAVLHKEYAEKLQPKDVARDRSRQRRRRSRRW